MMNDGRFQETPEVNSGMIIVFVYPPTLIYIYIYIVGGKPKLTGR